MNLTVKCTGPSRLLILPHSNEVGNKNKLQVYKKLPKSFTMCIQHKAIGEAGEAPDTLNMVNLTMQL